MHVRVQCRLYELVHVDLHVVHVCKKGASDACCASLQHHQPVRLCLFRREDHVLLEPSNGNQSSNYHHEDVHRGGCSAFFDVLPNES